MKKVGVVNYTKSDVRFGFSSSFVPEGRYIDAKSSVDTKGSKTATELLYPAASEFGEP